MPVAVHVTANVTVATSKPAAATEPAAGGGTDGDSGPAAPAEPAAAGGMRRVRVLWPYEAQEEDELTLAVGDVVEVISSEGEWWLGKLGGCAGTFPFNYVESAD